MKLTRIIKNLICFIINIICIISLIGVYSVYIEPNLLRVKHVEVEGPQWLAVDESIKIVQFTDTQLGEFYDLKDLAKVVDKINEIEPDIVVFTGDLIDRASTYEEPIEDVILLLSEIKAPLGKYAVYGNHDHGGGAHRVYPEIMKESGFTLLKNQVVPIPLAEGTINIMGIDDWLLGKSDLQGTLSQVEEDMFNILLMHEPDVVDLVASYPVDLQISGHSHGGQVRLPYIGTLITPPGAMHYTHGLYQITEQLQLYVNTGLGNTRLPFRLMNIPEITMFTFK